MEIKILYKDENVTIKAVYLHGELFYTKTIIFDADGLVEKIITVYKSGNYDIQ